MSQPASIDRRYVLAGRKTRRRPLIATAFLALLALAFGGILLAQPIKEMTTTYTQTEATVTHITTVQVLEGSRRNKHWVDKRAIEVAFTINGAELTDKIVSPVYDVGDTVTVWSDGKSDTRLKKPNPSVWAIVGSGVSYLVGILLIWFLVATTRNANALRRFDPVGKTPVTRLEVTGVARALVNKAKSLSVENTNIVVSGNVAYTTLKSPAVGTSVVLMTPQQATPSGQLGRYLDLYVTRKGSSTLVAHDLTTGVWWPVTQFTREDYNRVLVKNEI